MSKGLDKLKIIRHIHDTECGEDESINKDFDIIEKELKDFEWLKSKVSIDWFDKLSSDDKIRFMEIMGWKYE